jgi:hypothetical protein
MTLDKAVKRKTVEYNELVITREMLIDLVRAQRIGVSDDVKIEFDRNQTITITWKRSTDNE